MDREMHIVNAFDLNDAWFLVLKEIMAGGYVYTVERGSYKGTLRKQLDFAVIHVAHPGIRPLAPIVPTGTPIPTDEDYIEIYANQFLFSPDKPKKTTYTYGERLHEQLLAAIEILRQTPSSNQICIEVAQPSDFWLDDPPCLRLIQFQAHDGALDMYCYFRSWEGWAGLPTNLGGLQLVKEFVVSETGLRDGTITAASAGLHLYDYAFEWAAARLDIC